MNLTFSVLNNLTNDLQKTDIWENLVFTRPPYWMSKTKKKKTKFFMIFATFWSLNARQIVKIY